MLNAAARAGRAGYLANGLVLLIPEEVLVFEPDAALEWNVVTKLRSILPQDDRCIEVADPLTAALDKITSGAALDADTEYALNRFATTVAPEGSAEQAATHIDLSRSFGAFITSEKSATIEFEAKIASLKSRLADHHQSVSDAAFIELAAQSGASPELLQKLHSHIQSHSDSIPKTIPELLAWILDWVSTDEQAMTDLLGRQTRQIRQAIGLAAEGELTPDTVKALLPGVLAWINGAPLKEIELCLGGDIEKKPQCPRGRALISNVIPQALSYVVSLAAHLLKDMNASNAIPVAVLDSLSTAIRRGYDTPEKLAFAELRGGEFPQPRPNS